VPVVLFSLETISDVDEEKQFFLQSNRIGCHDWW